MLVTLRQDRVSIYITYLEKDNQKSTEICPAVEQALFPLGSEHDALPTPCDET